MKISKQAAAGTMESSDVYVEIEPNESGLDVQIQSVVLGQFGAEIRRVVGQVLEEQGVDKATVRIADRGALECVLRARVETAVLRGRGDV